MADMPASLEDTVLSLDPVPSVELALWEDMASSEDMASLEDMALLEDMVLLEDMALLEVLATLLLEWEVARCPTSLSTSLYRARTGVSPSQKLLDPLLQLLPTILAPPMASALTG